MSHTPHELAAEFPDKIALMHELKTTNSHFTRLAEEYHEVNRTIHRAETNVEPMEDLTAIALRKQRAHLKDEIWGILSKG